MKWPFRMISIIPTFVFLSSSFSQGNIQFFTSAGGNTEPSAILDIQSTDKGVLIPRMTSSERTAIQNPAEGLMVFQTDGIAGFYFCQNQSWEKVQDESESVPIGMVMEWWRPDAGFPLPEGYEICDGSIVSDPESPFDGFQLPNLLDNYVKGVTDPNEIGVTQEEGHSHIKYSNSHNSSYFSNNHNHEFIFWIGFTSTAPAHKHDVAADTISSSVSGSHLHKWSAYDSGTFEFDWISHNSSGSSTVRGTWGNGLDTEGVDYFLLGVNDPGVATESYYTKYVGHSHNITNPAATSSMDGSHNHLMHDNANNPDTRYANLQVSETSIGYHNHQLNLPEMTSNDHTDVNPPYYGLLKIIRIK